MPLSISSPKLTIKDRIKADWVEANVLDRTPDYHTGWLNPTGAPFQLCFPSTTEVPIGLSGYNAIAPDGPVSWRVGTLTATLFSRRPSKGAQNEPNPKKLVELGAREVERIIHAAFISIADFEYMSIIGTNEIVPDTDHELPFFGWTVLIQYTWRKTLS
jgi:hypothetical protein